MSCVDGSKDLGGRVQEFLRSRHPIKTAANVAAETGCGLHQVKRWLEGAATPNSEAWVALIATYGPEFLAAVMPNRFDWLDAAVQAREEAALEADIAAKRKRLDQLRANL
jgi:hypothetical protein